MYIKKVETVSTNNFKDSDMLQKIGSLWQNQQELVQQTFMNQEDIYIIYSDYKSDYKDDYRVSLGIKGMEKTTLDTDAFKWRTYELNNVNELGEA